MRNRRDLPKVNADQSGLITVGFAPRLLSSPRSMDHFLVRSKELTVGIQWRHVQDNCFDSPKANG